MANIEEWEKIRKGMEDIKGIDVFNMAKEFHKVYEEECLNTGWQSNQNYHTSFDKLPEENKATMLRTCARMIEWISNNQEDI